MSTSWSRLPDGVVHLWFMPLDATLVFSSYGCQLLSEKERMEAGRYRKASDRSNYVLTHTWLRLLLASYVNCAPSSLPFSKCPRGKPGLLTDTRLHFSLSHCGDAAIAAVRQDVEVGVDLERIDPRRVSLEIARRLFTTEEYSRVTDAPEADQPRIFFQHWTRLEARAKVDGSGVALAGTIERYPAVSLTPAPGFVAAVASRGYSWQVVAAGDRREARGAGERGRREARGEGRE